jgi:hypothetical protein
MNTKSHCAVLLGGMLLLGGCKAPTVLIDYCEISKQFDVELEDPNAGLESSGGAASCIRVFRSKIPYCNREKTGEGILEPSIAFDTSCVGPVMGYQHFVLFELENKDNPAKNSYHLLSCFEEVPTGKNSAKENDPAIIRGIVAKGGATMYSGMLDGRNPNVIRMSKRYLYTKPCKVCLGAGENAKPRKETSVDIEFHITRVQENGYKRIQSIDRIIRNGSNNISGNKPLVYNLFETIRVDRIELDAKPYHTCIDGQFCNERRGQ